MKKRWIAAGLTAAFFMWLALAGACNLNLLLTGRRSECTLRIGTLIAALADPREKKLFLLFAIAGMLAVLWMLFGRSYLNYESDLFEVVPGFKIPKPDGQGQHGTAWFMPQKKFDVYFTAAGVEDEIPLTPELVEFYENERRQIHAADHKPD